MLSTLIILKTLSRGRFILITEFDHPGLSNASMPNTILIRDCMGGGGGQQYVFGSCNRFAASIQLATVMKLKISTSHFCPPFICYFYQAFKYRPAIRLSKCAVFFRMGHGLKLCWTAMLMTIIAPMVNVRQSCIVTINFSDSKWTCLPRTEIL